MTADTALRTQGEETSPSGTLQRGLAILAHLGAGEAPTVVELMDRLDLSRSATFRILGVLRDHGLVRWDSSSSARITLGDSAILLGMTALAQSDVWEVARHRIRALAEETGEAALMAVVDGGEVVYVAHEDRSSHVVGVRRLLGVRRPLEVTSLGKAYAAALPPADVEALIPLLGFVPGTPTTITDAASFRAELAATRARGYAIDDGEQDPDVMCFGAAILDHREMPVYAISIAGPRERIEPHSAELSARVMSTAREISLRLGCPPTAYTTRPVTPKMQDTTKGKS